MKHKTLYHNGEIYTCNLRDEVARAMVVQENQILYVGPYREACRLLDDDTAVVDLDGKAVIPGFFDSFAHLQGDDLAHETADSLLKDDVSLSQKAMQFSKECAARGVTSVCCPTDYGADTVRTVTRCALKGNLAVRASLLVGDPKNAVATEALHHRLLDCGICTGLGDGFVRIGAAVVCANDDQALENNVARLLEAGMQLYFHTENEKELEQALSVYDAARHGEGVIKRAKVTVNFPIGEKLAERIITSGLMIVTSPMLWWEKGAKEAPLPLRMLSERGTLSVASFATQSHHVCPMSAVQILVTAKDPLSLPQALRACTYGGAYAAFAEDKVGSLEWGKAADFCLLSSSLAAISPQSLEDVFIEKTVIDGKVIYEKSRTKHSPYAHSASYRFPTSFSK
ncbi:MAG: amidohydrolase family protein [Clostridia bacterium]|nr:amidohydrolase family protein [Clostridia bacterium]